MLPVYHTISTMAWKRYVQCCSHYTQKMGGSTSDGKNEAGRTGGEAVILSGGWEPEQQ